MRTIPPRQQATLARRIAAGLPVWAAARGSNLPLEEVGELMWESGFREMIGCWSEILDMDPEARSTRLRRLAQMVIEEALGSGDLRAALLIEREFKRRRDPVVSLANGFSRLVDRERARAERRREVLAAEARPEPAPVRPEPVPESEPVPAAIAAAEAARRIRPSAHPADRVLWRKASELRHEMFGEQVLHHAVVRKAEQDRLMGPPTVLYPAEMPGDDDAPAFGPQEMELPIAPAMERPASAEPAAAEPSFAESDKPAAESDPAEPDPPPEDQEESDAAFGARATAMFNATFSQAPPEIRAVLETFSADKLLALIGQVWPDGPLPEGEANRRGRDRESSQGP